MFFLLYFRGGIWNFRICFIVMALAFVSWLRFTYRVEDGELKIESGVFVRKNRYIRFERIQTN